MKNIELKSIEMSYFISTGEKVKYDFQDGFTFVKGINKTEGQEHQNNGCGKSVIFYDSILFALFGVVSREGFTMSDIPFNKGSKKKCVVSLDLVIHEGDKDTEVNITRMVNPSKLILTVDGEDKSQSLSKATQEFINNNILNGIKVDVFKQSLAMDIKTTNSFLSMSKVNREKFIGGIFDLSYIKESLKMVRDDYNKLSKETENLNGQITSIKEHIERTKTRIQATKDTLEATFKEDKEKLKKLESAKDSFEVGDEPEQFDLSDEIQKLNKLKDSISAKYQAKRDEINAVLQKIKDIQRKTKISKDEIIRDESAKVCPTCKREMDEKCRKELETNIKHNRKIIEENKDIIDELEKEVSVKKKELSEFEKVFVKIEKKRIALDSSFKQNMKLKDDYEKKVLLLEDLKRKCAMLQEKISSGMDTDVIRSMESDLKDLQKQLRAKNKEIKKNIHRLEILNHTKALFGDNGIREVILSRIVGLFNKTLNMYLERLETPCRIEFDPTFNFVAKTVGGIEIPIGSLSGGERVRLDTALAFTFKDILRIQNQISFNMSLYDEWFDVSIDTRGLDITTEILNERLEEYKENPLIITHRKDLMFDGANIVHVIKENGQSRIELNYEDRN